MFDPKCWNLALYFAPEDSSERDLNSLAQHIQDAVEDWLRHETEHPAALTAPESSAVTIENLSIETQKQPAQIAPMRSQRRDALPCVSKPLLRCQRSE